MFQPLGHACGVLGKLWAVEVEGLHHFLTGLE